MFKKTLILLPIITLVASNLNLVTINHQQGTEISVNKLTNDQPTILNFKQTMRDAMEWEIGMNYESNPVAIDSYDSFDFVNEQGQKQEPMAIKPTAHLIGQPEIIAEDKTFNFMGHSVLTNNASVAEVGSTPAFEKDLTSTISNTLSFGISFEASCQFEIFGAKITSHFDSADTTETTITNKYTIPPQNITIPAKSQITVDEYWSQVKMRQTVNIEADITGWAQGVFHVHNPATGRKSILTERLPLAQVIFAFNMFYWPNCPKAITVNPDHQSLHFTGLTECWDSGNGSSFNLVIGEPQPIT